MERVAQMSVTHCLLQQKPKEVSRRSVQFPQKKADKSKSLHPNFRLFSKQPTTDKKRLVTAWCCFPRCWVVTWNMVLKSLCTWVMGVTNEVWCFSSSNKNQRKFHGVQFNFHRRRLTKANNCIRISGCSASNQRPTKKAGNGMVLFLSVLGCDMERGAQISVYMGRGCHE